MATMDFDDLPEDMGDDGRLKTPGTYHLTVQAIDMEPKYRGGDRKGQLLGGFEVDCFVAAGPCKEQRVTIHFKEPSLAHKDGGKFTRQICKRAFVAMAYLRPDHGGRFSFDGSNAAMRQFVASFKTNDKGYLELDGDKLWHVDDPAHPPCEKDQAAIGLLKPEWRFSPDWFRKPGATNDTNGAANGAANKTEATKAEPSKVTAAVLDDLSDI